jgi:hypothetical protein
MADVLLSAAVVGATLPRSVAVIDLSSSANDEKRQRRHAARQQQRQRRHLHNNDDDSLLGTQTETQTQTTDGTLMYQDDDDDIIVWLGTNSSTMRDPPEVVCLGAHPAAAARNRNRTSSSQQSDDHAVALAIAEADYDSNSKINVNAGNVKFNVVNRSGIVCLGTTQPDLVCLGSQPSASSMTTSRNTSNAATTNNNMSMLLKQDHALAEALEAAESGHGVVPMRKRMALCLFKCSICLEDGVDAHKGISLDHCGHEFCTECLAGYIKSKGGGSCNQMECPESDCRAIIVLSDIRFCLTHGDGDGDGDDDDPPRLAWSTFQEQATLAFVEQQAAQNLTEAPGARKSPNGSGSGRNCEYRRCPAEHCNYIFEYQSYGGGGDDGAYDGGCHFTCPSPLCRAQFCLDCAANNGQVGPAHVGQSCAARLEQVQTQTLQKRNLDAWAKKNAQASQKFRELVQQERSSGISKACPKCKELVTKNGGCDHMRCRCGQSFHWSKAK